MIGCEFCERLDRPQRRPWYDFHIVDCGLNFVTVAALGALVPGSVLIVPRRHVFSMAGLDKALRDELAEYEERVRARIAGVWPQPTLFEHGACADPAERDAATGACISHAHWHLVPGRYNLAANGVRYRRVDSFEEVACVGHPRGYLAFRADDGWRVNVTHRPPSQYFRRVIAAQLGMAGDWDYVENARLAKKRERGGFAAAFVLDGPELGPQ